jgi:hypothetical protein
MIVGHLTLEEEACEPILSEANRKDLLNEIYPYIYTETNSPVTLSCQYCNKVYTKQGFKTRHEKLYCKKKESIVNNIQTTTRVMKNDIYVLKKECLADIREELIKTLNSDRTHSDNNVSNEKITELVNFLDSKSNCSDSEDGWFALYINKTHE